MSDALQKPTGRLHKTREEEADRCLNHTEFSKGAAALVSACFLSVVFGVPLLQHIVEIHKNQELRTEWKPESGTPQPRILPQVYDVFGLLPKVEDLSKAKGFWGYWSLIPSGESISAFESKLKEESVLTKSLLSPAQATMTGWLGVGNEKAYIGNNGWLFYRPDVEYLTSPGFLDPAELTRKSHGIHTIQPDPVAGILDFSRQLKQRGIRLIVVPMSTKPMLEGEFLSKTLAKQGALQNPSFDEFEKQLSQAGVQVFDPTPILSKAKLDSGLPQYLVSDTHWTPSGMEAVAHSLSQEISRTGDLPTIPDPKYTLSDVPITNVGDIAEMLKLPKGQNLFPGQMVTTHQVMQSNGSEWEPDAKSDVLLLGDSFTNIYSLEGIMGWGKSAGFAEHLSYNLKRPLDRISINAGGAYSSRRALAQQMARGVDRLDGKKIVIYEFSMRDLNEGDWKLIEFPNVDHGPKITPIKKPTLPVPPVQKAPIAPIGKPTSSPVNSMSKPGATVSTGSQTPKQTGQKPTQTSTVQTHKPPTKATDPNLNPGKADGLVITGRIAARALTPKPGSVPYKDCLIALQITDIKGGDGTVNAPNIVVYVWGMRDNQLVDGAFAVGQTIRLKLTPWGSVESKYGGLNRQELDSDESLSWPSFWGELKP